jgi:ABC-type phosphate/phosphonate transport system substrate-binding protein
MRFVRPIRPTGGRLRLALALLPGLIGLTLFGAAASWADQTNTLRMAVSGFRLGTTPATFGNSSRNDTKAAITTWAKNLLMQEPSSAGPDIVTVFDKSDELLSAYESGQLDGVTLAAEDFPRLKTRPDALFLIRKNDSVTVRFALLVHRGSGIEDVRQLKGRKLVIHSSPTTGLAMPWLDTLLASRSLGLSQQVFGTAIRIEAAARAILQVFFRQADACVVALDTFRTAGELNPQVDKEIKPLFVSQALVPSLFFFHPGYNPTDRGIIESAIADLDKSPTGRQVLTVFQSEKLVKMPVSVLDETLALLAEHDRIKRGDATGGKQPQLSQTSAPAKN